MTDFSLVAELNEYKGGAMDCNVKLLKKLDDNTVMIDGVKYQKIEEPSKPKTLYIELEEYGFTKPSTIHDICDAVSNWLPPDDPHDGEEFQLGWNACLNYLRNKLK